MQIQKTNPKTTLFSKIFKSIIDGGQIFFSLFIIFHLFALLNIFTDDRIIEKSILTGLIYGLTRFVQLQFFPNNDFLAYKLFK